MAFFSNKNNVDVEKGNGQLYPGMQENPQMRWGFIRKVYCILCVQLLITFGIAIAMTLLQPVRHFLRTPAGLYTMIAAIILTVIRILFLYSHLRSCPVTFMFSIWESQFSCDLIRVINHWVFVQLDDFINKMHNIFN